MTWQTILAGLAVAASLITAGIHFARRATEAADDQTAWGDVVYLDPEARFSHRRER